MNCKICHRHLDSRPDPTALHAVENMNPRSPSYGDYAAESVIGDALSRVCIDCLFTAIDNISVTPGPNFVDRALAALLTRVIKSNKRKKVTRPRVERSDDRVLIVLRAIAVMVGKYALRSDRHDADNRTITDSGDVACHGVAVLHRYAATFRHYRKLMGIKGLGCGIPTLTGHDLRLYLNGNLNFLESIPRGEWKRDSNYPFNILRKVRWKADAPITELESKLIRERASEGLKAAGYDRDDGYDWHARRFGTWRRQEETYRGHLAEEVQSLLEEGRPFSAYSRGWHDEPTVWMQNLIGFEYHHLCYPLAARLAVHKWRKLRYKSADTPMTDLIRDAARLGARSRTGRAMQELDDLVTGERERKEYEARLRSAEQAREASERRKAMDKLAAEREARRIKKANRKPRKKLKADVRLEEAA